VFAYNTPSVHFRTVFKSRKPETGYRKPKKSILRRMGMEDKIQKFEDLKVWKESMQLAYKLYTILKDCNDYSLRDQIRRSAVSIPSNIAEGYDRNSNKEFIQFLYIAKGSCSELRTQLYLAHKLKLIESNKSDTLIETTRKISAMLFKLIRTRREKF
jgi:four helix bundle protein